MKLAAFSQLFSLRDIRNAGLGIIVILGGLSLSGLTLYAHQSGNIRLAGISAAASLVFVLLILVFVVPPLARNAGREASQLNLPFEFTTGGAIMLVLILIVGFSAWNTGNNLLFLVLSFMLTSMFVGFFAGSLCLKRLDVTMRFPDTIFAGEPTPIVVSVANRKSFIPSFSLVVEVRGKERERSVAASDIDAVFPGWLARRLGRAPTIRRTLCHIVSVPAKGKEELRTMHVFDHRGKLRIHDFELSTKFPFGFFRHRRRLPAREAELVVFPRLLMPEWDLETVALDLGKKTSLRRGMGQDLLALREYQPFDDLRRIDWKATAKAQHLTVREFASEDEKRVTVLLLTAVPPDAEKRTIRERLAAEQNGKPVVASDRFEAAASLAAAILSRAAAENAEIRLIVNSTAGEYGAGRRHLNDLLHTLALVEPDIEGSGSAAERESTTPAELKSDPERILNSSVDSSVFLITSDARSAAELAHRLKIITF